MDNTLIFGINLCFQSSYTGMNSLPFPSPACTENPTKSQVLKCILILTNPALGGNLKLPPHHAENNNFLRILAAFLNSMKDSLFEFQAKLERG